MRILMLTELYPPYIGGTEEHVRNLSRGLAQRGHSVAVATVGPPDWPVRDDDDGVRVYRMRSMLQMAPRLMASGRPYAPPAPDPALVRSLRKIVRDEQPDVVHAHNWLVHSYVPLKRRAGPRLVLTLHDFGAMVCAKRNLMYRGEPCDGPGFTKCLRCAGRHYGPAKGMLITLGNWASQGALRRAVDMVVPVSEAVAGANQLESLGLAYRVIPNFVPDDVAQTTSPLDPRLGSLPDEPFWLFVGPLSRDKGVHLLVQAYRGLKKPPPLVLIGRRTGDELPDLPRGVRLLVDVPHAAVMTAWRGAALGFVPSLLPDSCPTVALEAMACGVPVVASRIGGLPELVVDGESGILFEPGDETGLRAAMATLLADEDARRAMGAAAARRAPSYMASSIVPRVEALYAEMAA